MWLIYSDGACSYNPGPGGWAAVLTQDSQLITSVSGYEKNTTNNRMELTASIEGITECSKFSQEMIVVTDSIYVKDGITKWIYAWRKNNWKDGKIKNIDLWMKLSTLTFKYKVQWQWIKGHAGHKYNEMADSLARQQIKSNK